MPCIQPTEYRNTRTFNLRRQQQLKLVIDGSIGTLLGIIIVNFGDLIGVRSKETRLIARVYEQS